MLTCYRQPTEETRSSWVPSYSVRSQGSSPGQAPQQTTDADVAEIESLPAPAVEAEVPSEESSAPAVEVEVTEEEPFTPAAAEEAAPTIEEPAAEPAGEEVPTEETPVIVTEATVDEVNSIGFLCQLMLLNFLAA